MPITRSAWTHRRRGKIKIRSIKGQLQEQPAGSRVRAGPPPTRRPTIPAPDAITEGGSGAGCMLHSDPIASQSLTTSSTIMYMNYTTKKTVASASEKSLCKRARRQPWSCCELMSACDKWLMGERRLRLIAHTVGNRLGPKIGYHTYKSWSTYGQQGFHDWFWCSIHCCRLPVSTIMPEPRPYVRPDTREFVEVAGFEYWQIPMVGRLITRESLEVRHSGPLGVDAMRLQRPKFP
ncbi:hypothetical protein GGR54DRAFT_203785 [Hypoxylon sp. NC1633]|nr:hypothetical protein GGR54DRAFT_84909 [Hypoxylon sp. NC1633]KAI2617350.1 hypothetical protein GGR54DRAFT_203785 [Hypoxylon sp. NC1633]